MPFQPINFLNAPREQPQRIMPENLTQELMEAYKLYQMPGQMTQQRESQELINALNKAKTKDLENKSAIPFGGDVAPGSVGQAQWLERIRSQFGEESPIYKNALRAFESELSKTDYLNQYRNILAQTAPKRASTSLGKTEQEIKEIEEGYLPGSERTIKLSSDEQKELLDRYSLSRQKQISDTDTRKRALMASNVDKTLAEIDPKDLTQYGGVKGQTAYQGDRLASAFGKAPERFVKYQRALSLANLLAKQVRQFYGDSITPGIQEKLSQMTNPANWINNPEVALEKYNTFKDILEKETQTYRGSLKGLKEYEGATSNKPEKRKVISIEELSKL